MASLGLPLALDAACEIGRFNPVRCVSRISKQSFAHPFLRWFPANLGCRCSVAQSRPTLCDPRDCSTPGSLSFIISQSFCRLMIVEPVMPSNHLILCLPFSSCPQSFPASESFLRSRLFASGGQSIAASASVLPMNIQSLFSLGLASFISWQSTGLSRVFNTTVQKHQFFGTQPF